jgi:hypothetical protein
MLMQISALGYAVASGSEGDSGRNPYLRVKLYYAA